jgi:hypothetical protein
VTPRGLMVGIAGSFAVALMLAVRPIVVDVWKARP